MEEKGVTDAIASVCGMFLKHLNATLMGQQKYLRQSQEKARFKVLNLIASESMNDIASINENSPFGRKPSHKTTLKTADCDKAIN